jgi:hypothetical protein
MHFVRSGANTIDTGQVHVFCGKRLPLGSHIYTHAHAFAWVWNRRNTKWIGNDGKSLNIRVL